MNEAALLVQHPGSISQTEAGDMETDGIDSDDDNDVLHKSDQVCRMYTHHILHAPGAVPPALSRCLRICFPQAHCLYSCVETKKSLRLSAVTTGES